MTKQVYFVKDGKKLWRCGRCGREWETHAPMVGTHIMVGPEIKGTVCAPCLPDIEEDIQSWLKYPQEDVP